MCIGAKRCYALPPFLASSLYQESLFCQTMTFINVKTDIKDDESLNIIDDESLNVMFDDIIWASFLLLDFKSIIMVIAWQQLN